ncbi:MAG: zinc ribbon domain-containing protein [Methanobacteriaceae archaeon]
MKCGNCSKENEENAKFCKYCGKSINNTNKSKSKIYIAIGITIIILLIAILGALFVGALNTSTSQINNPTIISDNTSITDAKQGYWVQTQKFNGLEGNPIKIIYPQNTKVKIEIVGVPLKTYKTNMIYCEVNSRNGEQLAFKQLTWADMERVSQKSAVLYAPQSDYLELKLHADSMESFGVTVYEWREN